MEQTSSSDTLKLNIFALPNQTTILFLTIVAVFIGTISWGSVGTPYSIKSLALALLILPVREFFAIPNRKFKRYNFVLAGTVFEALQHDIARLAEQRVGLRRIPRLVCPEKISNFPQAGVFRQCFLEWNDHLQPEQPGIPVGWFGILNRWYFALIKEQHLEDIKIETQKIIPFYGDWHLVLGNRKKSRFYLRKQVALHTFGTFRRWYLAMDVHEAKELQEMLKEQNSAPAARAKLLHELYHFKTGDYWQLGYAGELLRLSFLIMLWAFLFFIGLGSLLIMARPTIQQLSQFVPMLTQMLQMFKVIPQELWGTFQPLLYFMEDMILVLQDVNQQTAHLDFSIIMIFSIGSVYPFLIIAIITWLIYSPALWRVREFYADAGVIRQQQDILPYTSAITRIPLFVLRLSQHPLNSVQEPAHTMTLRAKLRSGWKKIKHFRQFHPDTAVRLQIVQTPEHVFGSWRKTILLVGPLTILLEILMLTPLTLLRVGQWPMHFPTLSILVIVTLNYLIPQVAQGKPMQKDMLKIIGVVTLLRLAMVSGALLLFVGLQILRPHFLLEMLPASFAAASQAFEYAENSMMLSIHTFLVNAAFSNYAQTFVVSGVLFAALTLLTNLFRRMFTWYSYPQAEKYLINIAYLLMISVAGFTGLTVLPFFSALILEPTNFFNPFYIVLEVTGLLILIFGLEYVRYAEKTYSRRCPHCGEKIKGEYVLGKRCTCHTLLHPWLMVKYDV